MLGSIKNIIGGGRQVVSEIIGRISYVTRYSYGRSDDRTQADYAWYDRLRRGKIPTYKLGGLFVKPIIEHFVSWMMGDGFRALTDSEINNDYLAEFVDENLLVITDFVRESMALGDAYIVINPDGTLSAIPPNQVDIETDPLDYRRVISYTITTVLEKATIEDKYTLEKRTVVIKGADNRNEIIEYPNLIKRLPVVHLPFGRSTNEVYGHPLIESLIPLFADYDDVLTNSLIGVKTMSNPIPTLEEVENPQKELDALSTTTNISTDSSGIPHHEKTIDLDSLQIIATSGKFNLRSPASFTGDSWQMLKALFMLLGNHTGIMEWVWGGAISSSKASVEAQMPAWAKTIAGHRLSIRDTIREILEVYLDTISLYTPGITKSKIRIDWPAIAVEDKAMLLQYIKQASANGLITKAKELELLDLVENPDESVKDAKAEEQELIAQRDSIGDAWEHSLRDNAA